MDTAMGMAHFVTHYVNSRFPMSNVCIHSIKLSKPRCSSKSNCPLICKSSIQNKSLLQICNQFHSDLNIDSTNLFKFCPFGIEVCVKEIVLNAKSFYVYTLLDFKRSNLTTPSILSRKAKKEHTSIIEDISTKQFNREDNLEAHEKMCGLLETLNTGRLSLSIKALSHNILTPLQGAFSDLDGINDTQENKEYKKRLKNNLNEINRTVQEMRLLLVDEFQFSKNQLRNVVAHNVINSIIKRLESLYKSKKLNFSHAFNNIRLQVEAIPFQFELVLTNLIQNAIKYSYEGFKEKENIIDIYYREDGNNLKIVIANLGCKIEKDEIEHGYIYEPGYRGRCSGDRQRSGTGNGLYICNKILIAHGGNISITSTPASNLKEKKDSAYLTKVEISWPFFFEE